MLWQSFKLAPTMEEKDLHYHNKESLYLGSNRLVFISSSNDWEGFGYLNWFLLFIGNHFTSSPSLHDSHSIQSPNPFELCRSLCYISHEFMRLYRLYRLYGFRSIYLCIIINKSIKQWVNKLMTNKYNIMNAVSAF